MNPTSIFFGILFLILGGLFFFGKGHTHLAAWKNMPENEKEKVNILPLCRNIGGMIALCAMLFLISGIWTVFKEHAFVWSMILWLILAGADVYFIGKSKRYIKR